MKPPTRKSITSARLWLDSLDAHPDYISGNPEDLVHLDWSGEWPPGYFEQVFGGWEGGPMQRPLQGPVEGGRRHK